MQVRVFFFFFFFFFNSIQFFQRKRPRFLHFWYKRSENRNTKKETKSFFDISFAKVARDPPGDFTLVRGDARSPVTATRSYLLDDVETLQLCSDSSILKIGCLKSSVKFVTTVFDRVPANSFLHFRRTKPGHDH